MDAKHYVQLRRRHGAGFVRHLMAGIQAGNINTRTAAEELEVSVRRVQQIYADYLEAWAQGTVAEWAPGRSGGNWSKKLPEPVEALWRKMLSARPPAPYAFVASESLRRFDFAVDRATVRRWAIQHDLTHRKRHRPRLDRLTPQPAAGSREASTRSSQGACPPAVHTNCTSQYRRRFRAQGESSEHEKAKL